MLKIYDIDNKTLMEHNIHPYFQFKIETEPYTEFDEDATFIKVLNWEHSP